jgi:hypothetical protein
MHLMQPKHFIMPFLAHALGTLLSAFLIAKFAIKNNIKLALLSAFLFLIGGIVNSMILPSPIWFTLLDLGVVYIPMAYLGWQLEKKK